MQLVEKTKGEKSANIPSATKGATVVSSFGVAAATDVHKSVVHENEATHLLESGSQAVNQLNDQEWIEVTRSHPSHNKKKNPDHENQIIAEIFTGAL